MGGTGMQEARQGDSTVLLIGMLLPGCGGGGGSQETGPVEVLVSACAPSDEAPKLLDQLYLQHRPGAGEVSPSALPLLNPGPSERFWLRPRWQAVFVFRQA